MQGLNRKILYRKEEHSKGPPKPKEGLIEWLNAHPLIKISQLAGICGIDRGNLNKFIKAGAIPEKHRAKIEQVLKDYGYAK